MMNKKEYINQVHFHLKGMPEKDVNDALLYLDEYFSDAGIENEQEVIQRLGPAEQYAKTIKADIVSSTPPPLPTTNLRQSNTNTWKKIVILIMGLFSLPIALPLLICVFVLIFVAILVLVMLIFSFGMTGFAFVFSFFVAVYRFFTTIGSDLYVSIFLLGTILFSIGGATLSFYGSRWMIMKGLPKLLNWISSLYRKLRKKETL